MNFMTIPFFTALLFLFSTAGAVADEPHRIPDAPADYLAMENPYDVVKMAKDKRFVKRTGRAYKRKCQKCHGEKGDGKGPRAIDFIIKPAAFATPGYLANRKDGQLFWIIEKGSPGTEMDAHGRGSRTNLYEDEIWRLITFIRLKFTN